MTTFHGRDDVLSLLIHLGYLGFDDERSEVFIPNREILDEFRTSTKTEEWIPTFSFFEISRDQAADTALSQIKRQEYPDWLEHYKGNLLLIGINYNRELRNSDLDFKHHTCVIEKA